MQIRTSALAAASTTYYNNFFAGTGRHVTEAPAHHNVREFCARISSNFSVVGGYLSSLGGLQQIPLVFGRNNDRSEKMTCSTFVCLTATGYMLNVEGLPACTRFFSLTNQKSLKEIRIERLKKEIFNRICLPNIVTGYLLTWAVFQQVPLFFKEQGSKFFSTMTK